MARIRLMIFSVSVAVVWGCSPSPKSKNYVDWIKNYDNGYHIKKEYNDLVLDVQFQPSEYTWIMRKGFFDEKSFTSERSELDRISSYVVTISTDQNIDFIKSHANSPEEKQRLLYYFSYLFQDDIKLEKQGVQLPCVLYHFERSSSLNGKLTFVIGFENNQASDYATLIVSSSYLSALPITLKVLNKPKDSFFSL